MIGRGWVAIAIAAVSLATTSHAPWRVLGPLTVALVLGIGIRALRDARDSPVSPIEDAGLRWLATTLLRAAVVVSALRLEWSAIAHAGLQPWIVAIIAIAIGMGGFAVLARLLKLRGPLVGLIAIGTSVCGAAAITAAAPRVNASDEDTTIAIAVISVLGALLSLGLVVTHAVTGFDSELYGLVAGGSLHEVAHVVAAAGAVPAAAGIALLTKLARVALLPVGLVLVSAVARPRERSHRARAALPGLAIGFFVTSLIGSLPGWIPDLPSGLLATFDSVRVTLLTAANATLAVSMAAIGLRMSPRLIVRIERRLLTAAVLATLLVLAAVMVASQFLASPATLV